MNPFSVLQIGPEATPKDIIEAVALAMRERRYPAKDLALAQKLLLDPTARTVQEFIHFVDLNTLKNKYDVKRPRALNPPEIAGLSRLTVFDEAT